MRNIAGNAVRGLDYFYRKNLIDKAWRLIENDYHILIAAPRRVGKSSLMFYLMDNSKPDCFFLYKSTQSANNENEFFRILVNKIIKSDFIKTSQKITTFLVKHIPSISKIGLEGVEFGVKDDHNYKEILIRILQSYDLTNKKLIIMIDEFSETLDNIVKDEGERAGIHFLQSNQELRKDAEISSNIQFLYTGSIGLTNIVSKLNAMNTITELKDLNIPPLSENESIKLIEQLLEDLNFNISTSLIKDILIRIEWLIPFYIQLVIEKLNDIYRDENLKKITMDTIDQAFILMLEDRKHFEHWHTRLRAALKGAEYNFVKEFLNIASEMDMMDSNEIYDLAVKHQIENIYKDLINSLVYDGYINNNDDKKKYRFNSPILKNWWRQNVAN